MQASLSYLGSLLHGFAHYVVVGTNYVFIYQLFLNLKEDREGLQYGVVVR